VIDPKRLERRMSELARIGGKGTAVSRLGLSADEQRALARAGHAGAAEEGRQSQAELDQTAQERDAPDRGRGRRHHALADRAVAPRERPEAFARDHDTFGTGHPTEARQLGCLLGLAKNGDDPGAIHPGQDRATQAARQVPGGLPPTHVGPTSGRG